MSFYHQGKKVSKKDKKKYQQNKKKYQDKIKHQPKKTPQHVWQLSSASQRKQILQRARVSNRIIGKFTFVDEKGKNLPYAKLTPARMLVWNNALIYLRDILGILLI